MSPSPLPRKESRERVPLLVSIETRCCLSIRFFVSVTVFIFLSQNLFGFGFDQFEDAHDWSGFSTVGSSRFCGSAESGEPGLEDGLTGSLWWRFDATLDSSISATLDSTPFNGARLEIFEGSSLSNLILLTDARATPYEVQTATEEGKTYHVRLSSYGVAPPSSPYSLVLKASQTRPLADLRPFEPGPSLGSGGFTPGDYEIGIHGQPARLVVGQNYRPDSASYLCYYLHGDEGGYRFFGNSGTSLRQWIDEEGLIFIAPQAPQNGTHPELPNRYFPWSGGSVENGEENAAQVREVLDYCFSRFNLHRDRVLGASASGGSFFYDSFFFPRNGHIYPSSFLLGCGAGGMSEERRNHSHVEELSQGAVMRSHNELRYVIGTEDFLYDEALESSAYYTDFGFAVSTDFLPNVPHCGFSMSLKMLQYWSEKINQFKEADRMILNLEWDSVDNSWNMAWDGISNYRYSILTAASLGADSTWSEIALIEGQTGKQTHQLSMNSLNAKTSFFRLVRWPITDED